jgi:DNA-binding XRE family transcriptional regulator
MENNRSKTIRKNRVRELRENRLMTQAQLARKAKVALRTIHSVEKGMNCRMDTKRKILLALGLRFEDKDQVFPPISAFTNMGLVESMHAPAPVPTPTHGNGDGHGQGPTNPPHSF